ncbi:MAG TPA: putative zinc-binding protein [Spirochaetia bacterium]|nr:putative zinc-binding protein [Spirochaetia bacterium]
MSNKIKIVPCSGMGKVFGLVAREAALKVVNEICPYATEMICLANIVTADPEIREEINGASCLTIDGCPKLCASRNVEMAGGVVAREFQIMDIFKECKGAKPGNAITLTEARWKMVDDLAEQVNSAVRKLVEESV